MALHPDVLEVLRAVVDPEVGINIVDLGLVYRAERTVDAIDVAMTMTTRACPLGEMMLEEARAALAPAFPGRSADRNQSCVGSALDSRHDDRAGPRTVGQLVVSRIGLPSMPYRLLPLT
jgi:Iron-sulfur cluster assembly protein